MSGVQVLISDYEQSDVVMNRSAMLKSFDSDDLETSIDFVKISESPPKKTKL
jgi:hypothetical protein